MGGPNLGLVDIKLYVIDEYLRLAGGVGGIILVITITTQQSHIPMALPMLSSVQKIHLPPPTESEMVGTLLN